MILQASEKRLSSYMLINTGLSIVTLLYSYRV
jgi:hypothetical protein